MAMTGLLLLLLPVGLLAGCGGGDDGGDDAPSGYERVESDGLRFVMPAGLPLDGSPADGSLFVARKAGTLAEQARIVASVDEFPGNLLQAVGEVRDSNPTGVADYEVQSDVEFDVPGSEGARRLVVTFKSGQGSDIPTTRNTIVAQKGQRFYLFSVVVPDAKRGELDVGTIVDSLELT